MHTARAQSCKSQWLCDKHNCPQRDSIPGPRALQSGMLPLDHCDLQRQERRKCQETTDNLKQMSRLTKNFNLIYYTVNNVLLIYVTLNIKTVIL